MNHLHEIISRLLVARVGIHPLSHVVLTSLVLCCCFALTTRAQTSTPSPSPEAAATPENPFAPEKADPLPAGMTGSDVNDPRAKLTPGLHDAGEAALGMKHILLV